MRSSFVDEVTVHVRSGNGGGGCVAFRREKYVPFGGPNGGDGGRGGDVIVRVDPQMATLLDYRFRPRQEASNGQPGAGSQCHGADGQDVILRVPPGTIVHRLGEPGAPDLPPIDLSRPDAELCMARGGRGGKGNEHFKNSVRQAPRFAQPGEPGEAFSVRLELKLLADVGLVGYPNVGKSALIARISACRPKIADYPFTTLVPNLGVVRMPGWTDFVVADVPGLIAGAHRGLGLGNRFLRHLERVRVIAHLLTADTGHPERNPAADWAAIEAELLAHASALAARPRVMVFNRMDLPAVAAQEATAAAIAAAHGVPFFAISAVTGAGTEALLRHLTGVVQRLRKAAAEAESAALAEAG